MTELVRRFAVDWINRADQDTAQEIMSPDYVLEIGAVSLPDRAAYIDGTAGQLEAYPTLAITVHDIAVGPSIAAIAFTEHGPSARHELRAAAWHGVAIWWAEDGVFVRGVAEEDYFSRRRQLSEHEPCVIDAPAAAPWVATPHDPDPAAEAVVRSWLSTGDLAAGGSVTVDDGTALDAALNFDELTVTDLVSAGDKVAFRAKVPGRLDSEPASTATLSFAGLVVVESRAVASGWVVRDRLGFARRPRS